MTTLNPSLSPPSADDLKALGNLPVVGAVMRDRLVAALAEKHRRRMDALRMYRPMPNQVAFHASMASERVVRGGNRSGKSTCAFAEVASAVTGIPICDSLGNPLPFKYPKNRPLTVWVIGYDQKHIGATIYRMLFRAGAFKIIQDQVTKIWRAWNPLDPQDAAREAETRPAPPLIPARFYNIDDWAWENKGERVFSVARMKNGTEIHAFSSKGEPKMGDPVDLLHIDEDIKYPKHVAEWQARLSDFKGRLIWSAFPHSANEALIHMSRRAEMQRDRPKPDVSEVVLSYSANPYIDADEKRKRLEGWSEDERRARDSGEFLTDNVRMYPNFSLYVHGLPRRRMMGDAEPKPRNPNDKPDIEEVLRKAGWQPPGNWTRYLALDPGHATSAVLFAAVPPPEDFGDVVVIYDELYLHRQDAYQLAKAVRRKSGGQYFESFVIDHRASRQTAIGFGKTILTQYSEAFEAEGIRSAQTESGFRPGSDNVPAGIEMVREWLTIRKDGSTRLRVVAETTPKLQEEFQLYKKHVAGDETQDKPAEGQRDHLMDCLRYLAVINPEYVKPVPGKLDPSPAYTAFQEWQSGEAKSGETFYMGAGVASQGVY